MTHGHSLHYAVPLCYVCSGRESARAQAGGRLSGRCGCPPPRSRGAPGAYGGAIQAHHRGGTRCPLLEPPRPQGALPVHAIGQSGVTATRSESRGALGHGMAPLRHCGTCSSRLFLHSRRNAAQATDEELLAAHSADHIVAVDGGYDPEAGPAIGDIYYSQGTAHAARVAAGSTVEVRAISQCPRVPSAELMNRIVAPGNMS